MRRHIRYIVLCAGLLLLGSCSISRYVPEGGYRLNSVTIETDRSAPKNDRLTESDLDRYVRQSPANKFLGTNLPQLIYSAQDTAKNNLWSRAMRNFGAAPVIYDSALTIRSAENIRSYMRSRGFFASNLTYDVGLKGDKASVTYKIIQGEPYRIGDIRYDFRDEFLRPVVMRDSARTLLRTGDLFDVGTLDAERARITDYLKERGYYNFTVNNIAYTADSTVGNHNVDIVMIVRQYLEGYDDRGEAIYDNNAIYRIQSIFINPSFEPAAAAAERDYYKNMDTLEYRGLNILYRDRPRVRRRVLRQVVKLYPNDLYDVNQVQETYSNIMRLGYFRSAGITFDNAPDALQQSRITYIGSDDDESFDQTTVERYLLCNINCIPALRQSFKIDVEGSVSSNFFALGATLGYQNRNLFRGAELFDISLTGRYEFTRVKGVNGSYEIGGGTSVSFPRFVAPFRLDPFNQRINPKTKFELSINAQNRPYYKRTLSSGRISYSWNNRRYSSFLLRPVDINLIKVSYIDQDFLVELMNPYLIESYKSQLVAGISGAFTYNSQLRNRDLSGSSKVFNFNWETAGNLFSGLTRLWSKPSYYPANDNSEYYKIFGIRFAQYFRVDASFSQTISTGEKTAIAYRFLAGGGLSYGNSAAIPFDRLLFGGGGNSMRGWIVRRLGPGTIPEPSKNYPSQVGNLKLETNLEFRFPVWGFLHSAVFLDLGNVWFTGRGFYEDPKMDEQAIFRFNNFYRQLGFNTGLGLRLDFGQFMFRVDWGIKLHDPGQAPRQRWIHDFKFKNTAINFGVGYPF